MLKHSLVLRTPFTQKTITNRFLDSFQALAAPLIACGLLGLGSGILCAAPDKPAEAKEQPSLPNASAPAEAKKDEPTKPDAKPAEPAKPAAPAAKPAETAKPTPAPAPAAKAEPKKQEPKPAPAKKDEPTKPDAKPAEPVKPAAPAAKPAETAKPTPAPAPAAKAEPKKQEPKPAPAKKDEPTKPDAKPAEPAKPAAPAAKPAESAKAATPQAPPAKPAQPAPMPAEKKPEVRERVEIRQAVPADPKVKRQVEVRPAELKGNKAVTSTLGNKEQKIISQLSKLSTEQVRELTEVYTRLGNRLMAGILVSELQHRDPKDPVAAQLAKDMTEAEMAPDDPEATKAEELAMAGKPGEAAAVLQKLKAEKYKGKAFRYQQDLAYALLESGQEEAAKSAFRELLGNPAADRKERADAGRSLTEMALDALSRKGQNALTAKDARRAMQIANQLLERNPMDPDGIALKAAAISLQGRPQDSVNYLMNLKAAGRSDFFAHQKALADAFYDAKELDSAEEAYQAVLHDRRYSAEDRRDAQLRLNDLARDRLILTGEKALKSRDYVTAERIAAELEVEKPVHPDAKAFRAQILTRQHRYQEALTILEGIKGDPTAAAEPNSDLAEAYMNTRQWSKAAEEFTAVEDDQRQDDQSRFEAARLGREMRARYRPTVTSVYEAQRGEEGTLWSNSTEASSGTFGDGNNIVFVRSDWDQVDLGGQRVLKRSEAERWQAEVAYRRIVSHGFFGEVSVGGSDEDVVYGAKIGKYEAPGLGWEFSYRGNDRAVDSLQLEALNGRQNTLALYLGTHFSRRFYMDARFYFRQIKVDGHDLGQGWGLDMNVGYTLLEETRSRPELAVSYFNEISYFNTKSLPDSFSDRVARKGFIGDLSRELIDERINRHGIIITLSKQLNHRVNAYIYGGVSYEFETGEAEGRAGAGIEAYLNKNTSLNIGIDYTTSGNAGNRGSDVLSGNVGVRVSF